ELMKVRIEKVYDLHRIEHEEWRNGCKVLRVDGVPGEIVLDGRSSVMYPVAVGNFYLSNTQNRKGDFMICTPRQLRTLLSPADFETLLENAE
ncbi:hypothetical protein P0E55_14320, partial [Enterococcus faecalis]